MASIKFYTNAIEIISPSGLGFYGSSFGNSVNVGEYQTTTYITNSNGTLQGAQGNNVKFVNSASGMVGSSTSGIWLTQIPNYQATVNIRFEHSSAVKVQNVIGRIYDRSDINAGASGVTTKMAEVIHPGLLQSDNTGSGDSTWITPVGSALTVTFANSPGMSGLLAGNGSNGNATEMRHDWYACISQSPDSVGSKTLNAFYISLEYL
jgi:hypothetical protein